MAILAMILKLMGNYKTYMSAVLAILSGLGMILSRNYADGLAQIFQALLVLFGGATVVSMRHAIAKLETQGQGPAAERAASE